MIFYVALIRTENKVIYGTADMDIDAVRGWVDNFESYTKDMGLVVYKVLSSRRVITKIVEQAEHHFYETSNPLEYQTLLAKLIFDVTGIKMAERFTVIDNSNSSVYAALAVAKIRMNVL